MHDDVPCRSTRAWREDANGSSRRISALLAAAEHGAVDVVDHPRRRVRARARRRAAARGREVDRAERRSRVQAGGVGRQRRDPLRRGERRRARSPRRSRARCAPPTAGTGRARRESRTSARRDTGAERWSSNFEHDLRRAELDAVAGRHERVRPAYRPAVEQHAVGRAQVGDRPAVRRGTDLGVAARDPGVVEHDVAVAAAPDGAARGRAAAGGARPRRATRAPAGGGACASCSGPRTRARGAVDHRFARAAPGSARRRRRGAAPARAPDAAAARRPAGRVEPGLDPAFAQRKTLVGVEGDLRRRGAGSAPRGARARAGTPHSSSITSCSTPS